MDFYMSERKLANFVYRITELERKYRHIPFALYHWELLRPCVFFRFVRREHDLSLIADSLTIHSKANQPEDTIVVNARNLFLNQVYEDILYDEAIARAAIESDQVQQESEEEQEGEEDQEEGTADIGEFSLVFDPEDISDTLNSLRQEMEKVKKEDSERRIFGIGSALMSDDETRSEWTRKRIGPVLVSLAFGLPYQFLIDLWSMPLICLQQRSGVRSERQPRGILEEIMGRLSFPSLHRRQKINESFRFASTYRCAYNCTFAFICTTPQISDTR
jgi:hypothetical protein